MLRRKQPSKKKPRMAIKPPTGKYKKKTTPAKLKPLPKKSTPSKKKKPLINIKMPKAISKLIKKKPKKQVVKLKNPNVAGFLDFENKRYSYKKPVTKSSLPIIKSKKAVRTLRDDVYLDAVELRDKILTKKNKTPTDIYNLKAVNKIINNVYKK